LVVVGLVAVAAGRGVAVVAGLVVLAGFGALVLGAGEVIIEVLVPPG
jgi:hypothetical protein